MGIAVLGPLQIDGHPDGLSPRDRVVLSALASQPGRAVTTDALADALWGETVPASGAKVVQGCVVRLRKQLGAAAIESGSFGYRLAVSEDELDHLQFARLVERARASLADGDPDRSSYLVREALDLWRGKALADLEEWQPARVEAARLDALRMDAEELEVEAGIRSGRARIVLARAQALVPLAPFRERRWALLATALHQSGRQTEALGALRRARTMLAEEFGLDPGQDLIELEERLLRQDPSLAPLAVSEVSAICPYRGLLPYDAEDADTFFGREDDIAACLRRLRDSRVLAVIGPSGVGKSSLVRAGLVAVLSRSGTPVLVTAPGVHPLDSLVGLKPRGRQTLVVDQAEEAVTLCADHEERERYFGALAGHVGAGGALVLSLRSDHLGDLAPYPDIARVLEDGLYLLGPMNESDLRSAIEGPARSAGLRLEPGLVDLLVREVEGEPAALPMLSHVLRSTWEQREGPTLTLDGYKRTGGIRHAVSQSAESLYDAMDGTQRAQLRSLLLRLVIPIGEGDPVRARVPRDKVVADGAYQRLVERLVDARLVTIDGDTVQIAHEALVRVWPRLRGWLEDDVEGQRLFRHLAGAADAWESMGRPESELYRGARLNRTLEWRDRAAPDLRQPEEAFLAASVALSESELRAAETRIAHQRRVNRRLRGALAGVGVLMVMTLLAGLVAVRTAEQAGRDRDRAQALAVLADARRAGAQALVLPDAPLALLLAASALQVERSPEAWENLTDTLMRNPSLLAVRDVGGMTVALAASADGGLLAASRPVEGEGLHLMEASTLEPVPFEEGIPASGLAFSPDSRLLAMAVNQWNGDDGPPRLDPQPVRLYDMPGGTLADHQLGGFRAGSAVEYALDFSADGSRVVAEVQHFDSVTGEWDEESVAMVWDLAEPEQPLLRVRLPDYPILKLSPDGSRLFVALTGEDVDRPVRVYDVGSGRLVRATGSDILDEIGAFAADLSPDGSTFAVATASEAYRYDSATLRIRGRDLEAGAGDYVDRIEFSHDGSMLAAPTRAGNLVVWNARSGKVLHRFTEPESSWGIAFAGDDRTLYSSGGGQVRAWDLTGQRELFSVGNASDHAEYAVSKPAPDGRTLVRERLGLIWFVDNKTGHATPRAKKATHDWVHVWSPNSRWLLTGRDGGIYRLWEAATARLVGQHRFDEGSGVIAAFSSSSDEIYVARPDDTTMTVLDRASMEPARHPIDLGTQVLELKPHPTDGFVYAIGADGAVLRVDPEAGRVDQLAAPETFPAHSQTATLSPDGTRFAATNPDELMRLIDVATWKWYGPASEWGAEIHFAPDGSQIATLPTSGQLALHDGETGALQANLALPSQTPEAWISYLPDGSGLLVASMDGRTWTVATRASAWLARACRIAGRNLTQDEWREYFPSRPYEVTCPEWPAET